MVERISSGDSQVTPHDKYNPLNVNVDHNYVTEGVGCHLDAINLMKDNQCVVFLLYYHKVTQNVKKIFGKIRDGGFKLFFRDVFGTVLKKVSFNPCHNPSYIAVETRNQSGATEVRGVAGRSMTARQPDPLLLSPVAPPALSQDRVERAADLLLI